MVQGPVKAVLKSKNKVNCTVKLPFSNTKKATLTMRGGLVSQKRRKNEWRVAAPSWSFHTNSLWQILTSDHAWIIFNAKDGLPCTVKRVYNERLYNKMICIMKDYIHGTPTWKETPSLHSKPVIFLVYAHDGKKLHGDSSTDEWHNSSGGRFWLSQFQESLFQDGWCSLSYWTST